jgi:tetratricopeptide (TPR) repeat protein
MIEAKGDVKGAIDCTQKAYQLFRLIGRRLGEGDALTDLAWYHQTQGNNREAERMYNEALKIWNEIGHKTGQGAALYYLAWLAYFEGDFIKAKEIFPRAIEIAREIGNMQYLSAMHGGLGASLFMLGDVDKAEEMYQIELSYAGQTGEPQAKATTYDNFAMLEINRGNYDIARGYNSRSRKIVEDQNDISSQGSAYCIAGWIELYAGQDYVKAKEYFSNAGKNLESIQSMSWLSLSRAGLAASTVYLGEENLENGLKKIDQAVYLCTKKGRINHLIEEYRIKGDLAVHFKRYDIAGAAYRAALTTAGKYKMTGMFNEFKSRLNRIKSL